MSAKQPFPLSGELVEPRSEACGVAPPVGGVMTGPHGPVGRLGRVLDGVWCDLALSEEAQGRTC